MVFVIETEMFAARWIAGVLKAISVTAIFPAGARTIKSSYEMQND
jgi:hypothetical protein